MSTANASSENCEAKTDEERFKNCGPFPGCSDIEIERDEKAYPQHVGKLWMGSTWFTVPEVRALRDWLNGVLPDICETCKGRRFYTIHTPGNEGAPASDADDQPCPDCNANVEGVAP